jgi:lipopolysaccharide/colanic/teichoic acid biosynthesis glycosyltransferase
MKRLFDLVFSIVGLAITAPFFVITALLLLIFQGWPVFFVQTRVGLRGQAFRLLKFRTMRNDNRGQLITVAGDSRVTPIGAWLRKLKLDELPQLINVLKGDMSFVGPRPEVVHYVNMYNDEQRRVLELKPGITDPASLTYFDESEILSAQKDSEDYYIRVLMPEKIRINLRYGMSANLFTDLRLILITILRVFGVRISPMKGVREV